MKNEIMRLAEAMAVAMAGEKDAVALTEARAALGAAAEKLTAERDALKAELARPESTAVSMMRAENAELTAHLETLQYEVDAIPAIKAERDEYAACADTMAAAHKVERDALKDAARLASRALHRIDAADIRLDTGERLSITKAIAALKAVL